jgi:hypothetical protein
MHRREQVVFGHMHEDPSTELASVAELPVRSALVVASGGDLALALASAGLDVEAVDTNLAQLRLVGLKVAAARAAGAAQAAAWMGADARAAIDVLAGDDRAYWLSRAASLRHGLCFCGRVDRALRRLGPFLRWSLDWPGLAPGRLQRFARRAALRLVRTAVALVHGRAAQAKVARSGITCIESRVERAIRRVGARDDPLLGALLGTGFGANAPGVWTAAGTAAWLPATGRVTLRYGSLEHALLERPPGTLGLVSLSNVPDLGDDADRRRLFDLAAKALATGGRLVVRSMLVEEPDWRHDAFEALPIDPDLSPLCQVVWVGARR